MSVFDNKLEYSLQWGTRIGPSIGGTVLPKSFLITPPSPLCPWMQVAINSLGGGYTSGMAALFRPLMPNTGLLSLEFDILTDKNALTVLEALEWGLKLSLPSGYIYDGSVELNYQQKGLLMVYGVAPNPVWASTGVTPGRLSPNVPHCIRTDYKFDDVKHTMSTLAVTIDGVAYPIPASLQNVSGVVPTDGSGKFAPWPVGVYNQTPQLDVVAAGGQCSVYLRDMANIWG